MNNCYYFKRFLSTILFLAVSTILWAYDACIDGIYYNLSGEEAEVTYGDRSSGHGTESYFGDIVIPREVSYLGNRYRVTSIGRNAFDQCEHLTSITLPHSLTIIGEEAFEDCYSLTSITIPEGVVTIGEEAFVRCRGLVSAIIPNSVTTIDDYAFDDCISLTTVTIPGSVKSIGNKLFYKCKGLVSVVIENGVTYIPKGMFRYCTNLTSINIPNSVTSIGSSAFSGCTSLASITIPYSVTEIGDYAFSGCYFNENAFSNHSDLADADNWGCKFYDQETNDGLLLNDNEVLVRCRPGVEGVESVSIPKTVTIIEYYAFRDCTNLISISIPKNVKTIGEYAFEGCTGLVTVTIGNDVININQDSRFDRKRVAKAPVAEDETVIGNYAFYGCKELTTVTIGRNITEIGSYAFGYCDKLQEVYCLAEQLPVTDQYAFYSYDSYTENATLYVPESALDNYKTTVPWSSFGTILAIKDDPTYIVGDANGNGVVEIGDVTSVLTLIATPDASDYNNKAADANGNGVIEIGDVTTILTIMAGE